MGTKLEPNLNQYRAIDRIGAYDIVEPISTDGIGVIYHARELSLNRSVAIKLLAPELVASNAARERFRKEAVSVASINHENVVKIHYVGAYEEAPYLVMEYLDGPTLEERIEKRSLEPMEIVRIALSIALGLEAAHAGGVVHTDINPGNIVLERDRVVITNFGVASSSVETIESAIVPSPMFKSPEQVLGEPVDFGTDLFSLGSVVYAMATGRSPFEAATPRDVVDLIENHPPKPLNEVRDDIPEFLPQVVARLLEKDPERRDVAASDVAEACRGYIEDQTETATVMFSGLESPKKGRLKRFGVVGLIVVLLILGGVFAIATHFGTPDSGLSGNSQTKHSDNTAEGSQNLTMPEMAESYTSDLPTTKPANPEFEKKTAEWVLQSGGMVEVVTDGGIRHKVRDAAALPDGDFGILQIDLTGSDRVDDFDMQRLKGLATLRLLNLRLTACSGSSIEHLTGIDSLQMLILKNTDTDDTGLEFLAQMPKLIKINFSDTNVSDAGLSHVEELRGLVGLYLNGTKITDAVIGHFRYLKKLVILELNDTNFTDVGLKQLVSEHPNLTNLYLRGTTITNLSVPSLSKLTWLENLSVSDTGISAKGLAQLQKALPDCVFH